MVACWLYGGYVVGIWWLRGGNPMVTRWLNGGLMMGIWQFHDGYMVVHDGYMRVT